MAQTRHAISRKMSLCVEFIILVLIIEASGQPVGSAGKSVRFNSGDRAALPCDLQLGPHGDCQWLKDGWLLDLTGRYSSSKNCGLEISPVLPLDKGEFQCQTGGVSPVRAPPLSLTVNTEPSHPHILQGEKMLVERGETLELSCQSGGARPAAEIEWWNLETGERIVAQVTQNVQRKQNSDTFISTSTIKLTLDSPMTVKCSASNDPFPAKKYSDPLDLKLTGELTSLEVSEGASVRLDCERGRGEDRYDWYINNGPLSGEHSNNLLINNFVPSFDGAIIACEVQGKLIKRFKLNLMTVSENITKKITTVNFKPEQEKKKSQVGKRKSLYTCTFAEDGDGDAETIPSSVKLIGKPKKLQVAEDELNRKFQCRRFSSNKNKLHQIQSIMKSSGSRIRRIFKQLNQML